jgi:nucleoside transporter
MMFLQYFGMGAWIVPFARYLAAAPGDGGLGYSPSDVGRMYAALPIAGMTAPILIGSLADRFFAAEKLLAALQFGMAGLLLAAAQACRIDGDTRGPLFAALLGYAFLFMPSMTLTTVIALRNLENPARTFGRVRLIGTFGWIVSGAAVAWAVNPVSPAPLVLSAGAAVAQGVLSFFLPHTPPKGTGRRIVDILGLSAVKMFRDRSFVAFALAALAGNMMNQFYTLFAARHLAQLGVPHVEAVLTIGQWTEMGCMLLFPWLVRRYGLKTMMLVGLLGWMTRNAILAWGPVDLIVAVALPLHGSSYVFFTILGTLFVDREAPPHLRAGSQALVTFLSSGPAVLAGYEVAGATADRWGNEWSYVWAVPMVGCAVGAAIFAMFFREPLPAKSPGGD